MLYKLKENLPTIEILLGCALYFYFIIETTFSLAIIWLIFIVYLWLFTSILLEQYNRNIFINILCVFGILVSITLFFVSGVEELAYPEGALIFHTEGITKALLLFFISSVPLIVINKNTPRNQTLNLKPTKKTEEKNNDDKWEEATLDDLQSGNFETI